MLEITYLFFLRITLDNFEIDVGNHLSIPFEDHFI
jgi:hypothetical protein